MAEDCLARQHRLASQHLRADHAFRQRERRRTDCMFRTRVEISHLSASIDRVTREQKSEHRPALLERIASAKAEALRRIQGLPSCALDKDDWHREVEGVAPTADDAAQTLAEIQARVKRCRTASDSTPALCNEAQQAQLTAGLLLIEIQLDRLIELSRDWQSA